MLVLSCFGRRLAQSRKWQQKPFQEEMQRFSSAESDRGVTGSLSRTTSSMARRVTFGVNDVIPVARVRMHADRLGNTRETVILHQF